MVQYYPFLFNLHHDYVFYHGHAHTYVSVLMSNFKNDILQDIHCMFILALSFPLGSRKHLSSIEYAQVISDLHIDIRHVAPIPIGLLIIYCKILLNIIL